VSSHGVKAGAGEDPGSLGATPRQAEWVLKWASKIGGWPEWHKAQVDTD